MTRRFVFVPIFGDTTSDHEGAWLNSPHVKAWGFLDYHVGEFTPIHTDPPCKAITLLEDTVLFKSELKQAIDVPENSTDLPDAVCIALAKFVLMPVSPANSSD